MRFNNITTSLTLFRLLHLFTHLQAYTPDEVFTISCGTTGNFSDAQRTWTGDADSKLLSHPDDTVSAKATTQSPSVNQHPFATARLSRFQFNYSFPVTTDASFTVLSNQFTLLHAFNASLNADAESTQTIFKEYVVNVDTGDRLNLSFIPSQPNSYAFINGIEVLTMPTDLYYTSDTGFKLLGTDTLYSVESSSALETEYRIKVGGQAISPVNDTGLFRNWAGKDQDYLLTNNTQNNDLPADLSGKMNITVKPDYVAPTELYRTARNMGTNATFNQMNNLIWEFPIDTGFTYMIRLHFCELDPNITDIGDKVFLIYIASQVAEDHADVMKWSQKQHGLAVQRNYAVLIPDNNIQKKVNLSLQMHSYENGRDLIYNDVFLNGVEIFKISSSSSSLAGSNPVPPQTPQTNVPIQKGESSSQTGTTIGIVVGVVFGVVLISFVVFMLVFLRRKRAAATKPTEYKSKSTTTKNYSLPSHICRRFSLDEIKTATNNFDDVLIIGVGGFGHVYKGYVDDGLTPVAIKRLKPDSQQGKQEFMNEIEKLSQLRHLHLVSLVGYCNDKKEMILVYDFMTHGNLRDHLYNTDNPPLAWKQRLQICIGAARGLHYLHTGAKHMIIHRDVKTTNILLDDKWVAKVSDFGLSRIGPTGISKAHVSTVVKGSFGYLDPEYYKRHRLTEKSDVYSFGVVLFEILCGRPPLIHNAQTEQVSLAHWARQCYQSGIMARIVDPTLKGSIAPECFKKFCDTGVSCLSDDGAQRPSMNDVVWLLEFPLQLQESAEERENVSIVIEEDNEGREEVDDYAFCSSSEALSVNVSPSSASGEHSYGGMQVLAWLRSLDQNKLY